MIKTKSGARKIEGTDNWREIFDDHNYTVDALDQLADDMAIIVNGNKTAYASGAAVGQYVLLRNSTITDRADGMYKAAKAIPYNTTIDKTYLTAVSGGAINSLSDQIGNYLTIKTLTKTTPADGSYFIIDPSTDGIPQNKSLFIQHVYGGSNDVDITFTIQQRSSDYVVYVRQNGAEYRGKTIIIWVMYKT